MDKNERALLELLKRTIFGYETVISPETDWNYLFEESKAQTITPIIANSIMSLAPEEVRGEWRNERVAQIAYNVRYYFAQDALCELFVKERIPMAILKGASVAVYYPQPLLRPMGDIDFIVPKAYFEQAKKLLISSGYKYEQELDAMRHISYSKDEIKFELHRRFSYSDKDIERYIEEGLGDLNYGVIEEHGFPMLPKTVKGLTLLVHMRSHLKSGLGLRHLIDWMLFVNSELSDEQWYDEFVDVARENKLYILALTATKTCQKYLGLNDTITWCGGADDELCERLINSVLSSGNFGVKNETGKDIEMVATAFRREGVFHYLQRSGEYNWKAYQNHKWLKPLAWLYQILRYAQQGLSIKRNKQSLAADLQRSKDRAKLLDELDLA